MKPHSPRTNGFSLVELTLAIGIAGFCLVAVFALLPVGMKSNLAASEETVATGILSAVVADLKASPVPDPPGTAMDTALYKIAIPAGGASTESTATLYFEESGTTTVASGPQSRYRLDITFLPTENPRAATQARLQISWPALAEHPEGSVMIFLAIDRNG